MLIIMTTLQTEIKGLAADIKEIKKAMSSRFVTREEFEPVRKVVYGMVGIILMAVIGAMVALVLG